MSQTPPPPGSGSSADDSAEYLQVFIDESVEELDQLVEAILQLEADPANSPALNKAFRMLHSLKGSCGVMGFEAVETLAHELEDRFESYRSGQSRIGREATTLFLRCIDFFRSFIDRLRTGDAAQGDPGPWLQELSALDANSPAPASPAAAGPAPRAPGALALSCGLLIRIRFRPGLQLADLKARLIVSKVSAIGEVLACEPPIDDVQSFEELPLFSLTLLTDRSLDEVRKLVEVDGVESIEIEGVPAPASSSPAGGENRPAPAAPPAAPAVELPVPLLPSEPAAQSAAPREEPEPAEGKAVVNDTVRVDIERLDKLMNLTGELVVANARFQQITAEMGPVFRRDSVLSKSRDVSDRLRQRLLLVRQQLGDEQSEQTGWTQLWEGLEEELSGLDEHSGLWDEGHRHFVAISEAVDQLARLSKNLQRRVLNTRMVPVSPLFNRFRRVVRDLSVQRQKQVQLAIQGEKTELDKRMIDALADPLLHLVRNAIDHALESPEERIAAGKPETGTITLAAAHRGNSVLITVRDDGAGIQVDKILARAVARGLATPEEVRELSDQQVIDFIWHPGFSTAEQVTEISGRGVGMDIVRSAIAALSGVIQIATTPGAGTTFTIRLPLTLAIIHSLLIRFEDSYFSLPIEDVREIVSVPVDQVYAVHRHRTIDVRGELISLASMDSIFAWGTRAPDPPRTETDQRRGPPPHLNVVILQARGRTLGLCVDALVGRADIVIKSLAENYQAVRGLSGASIMGDGAVCLMLDSSAIMELAAERTAHLQAART